MNTVLTISSLVAAGPVGNTAIVPALQSLGIEPVSIPTVVQSNHPGHGSFHRLTVPPEIITAMIGDLEANGLLKDIRIVVTGYFGNAAQVHATASAIGRLRASHPGLYYLCDPVIGDDDTGFYVAPETAAAVRDHLVPLADGMTPNAFELGWLTGLPVRDAAAAAAAALNFPGKDVFATSIPAGPGKLSTGWFRGGASHLDERTRFERVPNGTGDVLAALIAGWLSKGSTPAEALDRASGTLDRIIAASAGTPSLQLANIPRAGH